MGHEGQEVLIKDALVFLFAAGLVVPLLRILKLPAIVGFILAGVALGPSGISTFSSHVPLLEYLTISDPKGAAPFAELGVLFLLFLLGLELSFSKLWALRRVVFGSGTLQAGLSAAVIGYAAYLLGLPAPAAILVGLALALSSTAIVMQILIDNKRAASPIGRTALGVLLLQDILVAPILIYAGLASGHGDESLSAILMQALFDGLLALVLIFVAGRFLLSRLFRLAASAGGRDFLMAITLLTVVGASVLTASAGLSIALGAFLAGLLLGETEFKHQAEIDLEPFKGLLLGLFFLTVGLNLDVAVVLDSWPIVIGGLVALLLAKVVIAWVAVRLFAGDRALSLEAAFLLAPAGEFAFVIIGAGMASGVIDTRPATLVTAIAGLSMLLTTSSWHLGKWLSGKFDSDARGHRLPQDFTALEGHILIVGLGRVGKAVARIMESEGANVVALDTDPKNVSRQRKAGRKVYFGDGSRAEALHSVGVENAAMVIVTLNDAKRAEALVKQVRQLRPAMPILARAQDEDHTRDLFQAGASFVIPDAVEAGLQMSIRALEEFGYDSESARAKIASEREEAYQRATAVKPG